MLKVLTNSHNFTSYQNTKCAEIFCQTSEDFSIVCTFCELKIFDFNEFLLHFRNTHIQNNHNEIEESEEIPIKIESELLENTQQCPSDEDISENPLRISSLNLDSLMKDFDKTADTIDPRDDKDDYSSGSGDSAEYSPTVLKTKSKKPKKIWELFKCPQCKNQYKHKRMLEKHIKTNHAPTGEPLKCTTCDLEFPNEIQLKKHERKEHRSFPCLECDRVYKNRESLITHMFNHTGERSYVCDVENCGKAFFNKKILCSHKRVVHTERNFVCEECGFRTKIKAALVVHKRSHTGERPFVCKDCGKGFASSALLYEHGPIHSTERPHKCDVCGAAFSRPKALYHHKHLHLDVKKFVCKICGRAYAQAAGLAGHMRQHRAAQHAVLM